MERDNDSEIINVDGHTQDVENDKKIEDEKNVKTVQVPFARERKKSVYLQDPFTDPPATTPRVRRKRKQKEYKESLKPLLGPDGKEIQVLPWTEVHTLQ